MSCWSICELQYMIDNYKVRGPTAVAKALGRDVNSVSGMAGVLGIRRDREPEYSKDEANFLRKNWGKMTIKAIAKRLKRSEESVKTKAKKLKLGPIYDPGKFNQNEIEKLTGISHQTIKKYINQGLLQATRSKTKKSGFKQISSQDLLEFLRNNPDKWDSRRAQDIWKAIHTKELEAEKTKLKRSEGLQKRKIPEELRDRFIDFVVQTAIAGRERIRRNQQEPDWLKQKRKRDKETRKPREGLYWAPEEDELLRRMFKEGKTYKEIGQRLGRSAGAINNRLARIAIWEQPLRKAAR